MSRKAFDRATKRRSVELTFSDKQRNMKKKMVQASHKIAR